MLRQKVDTNNLGLFWGKDVSYARTKPFCGALVVLLVSANAIAQPVEQSDVINSAHRKRIDALKVLTEKNEEFGYAIHTLIVPAGAIPNYNFPVPVARIRYESVPLFDFNVPNLRKEFIPVVEQLAAQFKSDTKLAKIAVVGHTDSTGTDEYNHELSLKRATAVANLLRSKGVPERIIAIYGFGEAWPIASNTTEAGRALNRRVEFFLSTVAAAIAPSIRGSNVDRNLRNNHEPACNADPGTGGVPEECGKTAVTKFSTYTLSPAGQPVPTNEVIDLDGKTSFRVQEIPEREHIPTQVELRPHMQ
jgi:outer membrane protein OmpA-like peptidoglycan-associated protein